MTGGEEISVARGRAKLNATEEKEEPPDRRLRDVNYEEIGNVLVLATLEVRLG